MAVPSMLIVAPKGTMKEAVELSTPNLFSTLRRVTGMVALELDVLKANICAVRIFFKNVSGLTRPNSLSSSISVPVVCSRSAATRTAT